jgi:hypothetical protein
MARKIDEIRASKLPSNMMQFAARGALSVPPAENIEILVYLARHNKVFGDLARMTLAGWDEKASLAAAADPQTPAEVLAYLISPDNLRPKLLPALLENPSVREEQLTKLALSAARELIEMMLQSQRIRGCKTTLDALKSNPYVKKEEAQEIARLLSGSPREAEPTSTQQAGEHSAAVGGQAAASADAPAIVAEDGQPAASGGAASDVPEPEISAYLAEHAVEIAAEEGKPFQPIGGIVDLLGADYFPVSGVADIGGTAPAGATKAETSSPVDSAKPVAPAAPAGAPITTQSPAPPRRENTMQKINGLDVKGRIQLALKGNKEERSILIRDGTKVVALAVLEAPKLADGEVEKFASQKNVLEAVLRQIPLKRRFMKNYIVVRNLVANPRTPLDLGLGLMKNLLVTDLKNLSNNKEVSETIRNLAMKMYKQKLDAAAKR